MAKQICIIGFSQSTRDKAPTGDDWEYWGMNHLYPYVKRPWSRWFEMHSLGWIREREHKWPGYIEWLSDAHFPVMMQRYESEIPSSEAYPIDDVRHNLDIRKSYFASTAAYALAYAVMLKPERIAVYGFDMVKEDEYIVQRANFEYLLGIAHGRGIVVDVPPICALLKSAWLYGYESSPVERFESERQDQISRVQQLKDECEAYMQAMNKSRADYHTHNGAYQEALMRLEHLNDLLRGALYGQDDSLDTEEPWERNQPKKSTALRKVE